jgi:class 3 adenylate cyclase
MNDYNNRMTGRTSPKVLSNHYRVDMTAEVVHTEDSTRTVTFSFKPNERRYETIEREGKKFYIDKYIGTMVSQDDFFDMMKGVSGKPIYHIPAKIGQTPEYAGSRLQAIQHELTTGEHQLPIEQPSPHRAIPCDNAEREVSFLSVDICGATALRAQHGRHFDRTYQLFLQELGTVVGQFNGSILKTTGDGFIAYVHLPSIYTQSDHTIDLGLSMRAVLNKAVNKALSETGFPTLSIRIGADQGPAIMREYVVPATGFLGNDIVSDALNRAVKIQESCQPNQFRIGRMLYELIHVQWLERAKEITALPELNLGMNDYPIYEVN